MLYLTNHRRINAKIGGINSKVMAGGSSDSSIVPPGTMVVGKWDTPVIAAGDLRPRRHGCGAP